MKWITRIAAILGLMMAISTSAFAVNNRTFIIDAPAAGADVAKYAVYCGVTNVTNAFTQVAVATVTLPTLTTGVVPLPDTVKFCGAVFLSSSGLTSPFSNVVSVTVPNAPVLRISAIDIFAWDDVTQQPGAKIAHTDTAEIVR